MKKLLLNAIICTVLFSCQKEEISNQESVTSSSLLLVNNRGCGSHEYLLEQLKKIQSSV